MFYNYSEFKHNFSNLGPDGQLHKGVSGDGGGGDAVRDGGVLGNQASTETFGEPEFWGGLASSYHATENSGRLADSYSSPANGRAAFDSAGR